MNSHVDIMNIFETRSLTHTDDNGTAKEILMTAPMPVKVEIEGEGSAPRMRSSEEQVVQTSRRPSLN